MAEIFEGLDILAKRLAELAFDTRRVERPLHAIGVYMIGSVEKNFEAQGRPEKWTPLSPATLRGRRGRGGKGKYGKTVALGAGGTGAKILMDTGRLKNSIKEKIQLSTDSSVSIGSNVKYARRQQKGFPRGEGRGHSRTPARPFLLIQDEDVPKIQEIVLKTIEKK
jgi:phage gpG-like protein